MPKFGERLRDAMLAAGLETPAQLARACGVQRQTIRKWLRMSEGRLSALYLLKLSETLRVRMRWLMTGRGSVPLPEHFEAAIEILSRLSIDKAAKWLAAGLRMAGAE